MSRERASRAYRAAVPRFIRQSRVVAWLRSRVESHDWIYNDAYYASDVEEPAARSSREMADSIVADFAPRSVVDVGCGTGALLETLRARGCETFGLEYATAGLEYCRRRGLDVARFDLESRRGLHLERTFDVAISMEVAEHLPANAADRFVSLLTQLGRRAIVFTAATPGQGGIDHVNEQPHAYWIAKFLARGFEIDTARSDRWRRAWMASPHVADWYAANLMIFVPAGGGDGGDGFTRRNEGTEDERR